jgi:energy-coupling factor transport system ATP-binding protein
VNLGASRQEAAEIAERVLQALDLWEQRELHPFRLSKGGRQRLAIAAIAAMRPPVMIIDEPTTGQDRHESDAIMSLLVELAREASQTVVVITHTMDLVAAHCDLMAVLCQGELIALGPPEQVFREEAVLRRTYVKPPAITALGNRLGLEPRPLRLEDALELFTGPQARLAER